MTVVFVTDKFPHLARAYINNQIDGFIQAGVDVYIVSKICPEGLESIIDMQHPLYNKVFYYDNGEMLPLDILSKADIIYCQFGDIGEEILTLKLLYNFKGKVVVCFRGADVKPFSLVFDKADLILPVCQHFKNQLIQFGCPPEKILVHHSAIDCSKYKYNQKDSVDKNQITIVSIGRLHKKKGFKYLIQAVDELRLKYKQMKCFIFGEGGEKSTLEKEITTKNMENYVFLKGHVPHQSIPEILYNADLFVLPSCCVLENGNQEGIPNVLMEAMAAGLPVISTFHSGIPELIEDEISGFLVPQNSSILLVKKIIYVIEHPELWESIGKAARKKVLKNHCKEIQNKKFLNL
jgi:colanic acid/amylovoran biosynthesis glycosyltransferase